MDDTTTGSDGAAGGLARGAGERAVRLPQTGELAAGMDALDGTPRLTPCEIIDRIVASAAFQESAANFARLTSSTPRPQYDAPWNDSTSDRAEHGTHWGAP